MPEKFYVINAAQGSDTAEILIYKPINSDWDMWFTSKEDITAQNFVSEFKALENNFKNIHIRINSPGGYVFDGSAIFNAIYQSKANTKTFIDGLAASMASIIALASNEVEIAPNGMMMLHSPLSCACGNAKDFRETADTLDKIAESLMTAIIDKTGLSENEVKEQWFDYADHWLTAKDCLEAKLVDKIGDKKGKVPENVTNMAKSELFNFYQNNVETPVTHDELTEKLSQSIFNKFKSFININSNQKPNENMKKFALALKLDEKADEKAILDAIKALQDSNASLTSELETSKSELTEAQSALETAKTKAKELEVEKAELNTKLAQKPASAPAAIEKPAGDTAEKDEYQIPADAADEEVSNLL